MTIPTFFQQYFDNILLDDLAVSFGFETAQVHLVPVVPGDYDSAVTSGGSSGKKKRQFSFGRQRVQDILQSLQQSPQSSSTTGSSKENDRNQKYNHQTNKKTTRKRKKETKPMTTPLSKGDRLLIQPTSFGGSWQRSDLAHVVRSYLNICHQHDEDALLKLVQVVWPSQAYVQKRCGGPQWQRQRQDEPGDLETDPVSSTLFLSSQVFNSCDVSCLSRMALYQPSQPPQRRHTQDSDASSSLVPHFKSVARLVSTRRRKRLWQSLPKTDEYLDWFLLTSACFSHGAQGKPVATTTSNNSNTNNLVSYANFELGVLFTSTGIEPKATSTTTSSRVDAKERRRKKQKRHRTSTTKKMKDRIYAFHPHECTCRWSSSTTTTSSATSSTTAASNLIHLPIPYALRPPMYMNDDENDNDDDDDDDMAPLIMRETPSFHEILDDSRCVGNMLLTPYGRQEEQQERLQQTVAAVETKRIRKQRATAVGTDLSLETSSQPREEV